MAWYTYQSVSDSIHQRQTVCRIPSPEFQIISWNSSPVQSFKSYVGIQCSTRYPRVVDL